VPALLFRCAVPEGVALILALARPGLLQGSGPCQPRAKIGRIVERLIVGLSFRSKLLQDIRHGF